MGVLCVQACVQSAAGRKAEIKTVQEVCDSGQDASSRPLLCCGDAEVPSACPLMRCRACCCHAGCHQRRKTSEGVSSTCPLLLLC